MLNVALLAQDPAARETYCWAFGPCKCCNGPAGRVEVAGYDRAGARREADALVRQLGMVLIEDPAEAPAPQPEASLALPA